jgi:hypothetical protein
MAERKSIHHGLRNGGHGADEHGLGGLPSLEDPRDFAVADHPGYGAALAATWLQRTRGHRPPRLRTPPVASGGGSARSGDCGTRGRPAARRWQVGRS